MTDDRTCAWCRRPTYGHYVIVDGRRYCHQASSPTCYEQFRQVPPSKQWWPWPDDARDPDSA